MDLELLFLIANAIALAGRLPLFLGMRSDRAIGFARIVAVLLAAGYLILFLLYLREARVLVGNYSLEGIGAFFSYPGLLLLGWVHYLAFDLFVGSCQVKEARKAALPQLLVLPCLILTFLLGPIGFLAFVLLRSLKGPRPAA
jgi:hypothetical protein